ncbi:MAG: transporter permease [Glaciihabitans sp.]|nr:transporter permease [Glaciihabitans sp.]
MTVAVTTRRASTPFSRYRQALWLLTARDLKVRYTTSFLGYFWSIVDPLIMSLIYYFVFTVIFHRGDAVHQPYIVFLLTGLLPWMWFTGSVGDTTRAFLREQKLIRSTRIPRTIWVLRLVLSKGIEFIASVPVVALFALLTLATKTPAHVSWDALLSIPAFVIEAVLIVGIGLIVAPLVVFFRDLERAVKLALRFLFYASPIVYGLNELTNPTLHVLAAFNPLSGIFSMYRASFFPAELDWFAVWVSAAMSVVILGIGILVFKNSVHRVLKEL